MNQCGIDWVGAVRVVVVVGFDNLDQCVVAVVLVAVDLAVPMRMAKALGFYGLDRIVAVVPVAVDLAVALRSATAVR